MKKESKNVQHTKPADGISGCLLYLGTGQYVFRVYDDDYNYVDYKVRHSDLLLTIEDQDAYFYYDAETNTHYLDHSPETLGCQEAYEKFHSGTDQETN